MGQRHFGGEPLHGRKVEHRLDQVPPVVVQPRQQLSQVRTRPVREDVLVLGQPLHAGPVLQGRNIGENKQIIIQINTRKF